MIPLKQAASKRKILLLDDEERVLIALRAVLRHHYQVTIVTEGKTALEALSNEDFHVFISDQRMPNLSGVEVLRHAHEISPGTTRLLLTGYSDLAAIVGSVNECEVFRFINKPWDNAELLAIVNQAADISESARIVFSEKPELLLQTLPRPVLSPNFVQYKEPVLILDQDPAQIRQIRDALSSDFNLAIAGSTDEALHVLAETGTGVIVVDICAGDSVLEFLKILKQEYPQVLTIVATLRHDSSILIDLINQVKIFRYLHKPYRMGELHRYIDSALALRRKFKVAPALVKQQAPQRVEPTASASIPAETLAVNSSMMEKVRALGARLKLSLSGV